MTLKEFFKPSWIKVALSIFIFFLAFALLFWNAGQCFSLTDYEPDFPCDYSIIQGIMSFFGAGALLGDIFPNTIEVFFDIDILSIIFEVIWVYLLVCSVSFLFKNSKLTK